MMIAHEGRSGRGASAAPVICSPPMNIQARRLLVATSLLSTTFVVASPAYGGDASFADQAAADALFRDAEVLLKQGKVAEACPKFAEAQRLDPTPGGSLRLGDCYERWGKLASAWGAFNDALALAKKARDEVRRAEAQRRADLLVSKLPSMILSVPAASRVDKLEVTWDGKPSKEGAWGSAIPADPGEHEVGASAPGRKPWSVKVVVPSAGSVTVEVPLLPIDPSAQGPGKAASAPVPFWGTQRIAGVAVGSVGVAGLIVGAITGGLTLAKAGDMKAHCSPDVSYCDPTGLDLHKSATLLANVANAGLIVGGVALAAGVIVFVTAPKATTGEDDKPKVAVSVGAQGFSVKGAW